MKISNLLLFFGNIIYHFDRALFNLLIPFLAPVFFPKIDPIYALIAMYIITPITIFIKPLGAIFFGSLEKKIGRSKVLSLTLMGMAFKTSIMSILPTYAQIGYFAPLLLTFVRIGINFFSGSETAGGSIIILEKTKYNNRNFISSLFDASGIIGVLLASFSIYFFCIYENFWRYLFLIGGIIGFIGWYFRKIPTQKIDENIKETSTLKTLFNYKKEVLLISTISGFSYANYYLITTFMNGYLPMISNITNKMAFSINNHLLLLDIAFLVLFGLIACKIKKENLIFFGLMGSFLFSIPLFLLLENPTFFKASFLRISLTFFGCCIAAPYHSWVFETAPNNNKLLISSFANSIGSRLFGSSLPAITLWLYKKTNLVYSPGVVLFIVSLFSLIIFTSNFFKLKKEKKLEIKKQ